VSSSAAIRVALHTGLALVSLRVLARLTEPDSRTRLQRHWAALGAPELTLAAFFFVLLFLFHWGFQRAASDGREYFVQVRSLVMDRDLDFANENATFGVRGTAGIYAFGTPLLWAPFYLAAHYWLGLRNLFGADFPRLGFFNAYQRGVGIGTLVYGFIALVLIYRILTRYFSRWLALASTLALACGSFIIWYLVADNSLSHGASMFATTLFLYIWHEGRNDDSPKHWAVMGACAGLMSMVRWQNVLFLVFPAADAVRRLRSEGRGGLRAAGLRYAGFAAAFFVASLPQLIFWKSVLGSWIAPPASSHSVAWTDPRITDVLFSSDRGLFSWTPILLLAVLGIPLFARRDRFFAGLMSLALIGQIYINSLVEQGGHGFGARKFAGCALIFALGLAALIDWLRRRPALAVGATVGTLILVNGFFMLDMRAAQVPVTGSVSFGRMLQSTTGRLGNPFSLPMGALFAWRYGADLTLYERLGKQEFNNVHIDFGTANDDRFLAGGWADREGSAGSNFRWSAGAESGFVVRLRQGAAYTLEIAAAPLPHPDGRRQDIAVWVNGELASRIVLQEGMRTYRADIPAELMRSGYNQVVLRYGYAVSPFELGVSGDRRVLAVQYDRLSLLRRD